MEDKRQILVNLHTSGANNLPDWRKVREGEIVVRHNAEKPELLIKTGDDKYASFIASAAVASMVDAVAGDVETLNEALVKGFSGMSADVKTIVETLATKEFLNEASGHIETTINNLKDNLEKVDLFISGQVSANTDAISTLVDDLSDANASIAGLGAASAKAASDIAILSGDVKSISAATKNAVSALYKEIDSAYTLAVKVSGDAYTEFTLVYGEIEDINEELNKSNSAITKLQQDVNGLGAASAKAASDIVFISGAVNTVSAVTDAAIKSVYDSAVTIAISSGKNYVDAIFSDEVAPLKSKVGTLSGDVYTLIGADSGMTARAIAAAEVAKIVDNADGAFDTLREIAEWIGSDNSAYTATQLITDVKNLKDADVSITSQVSANTNNISTLFGDLEDANANIAGLGTASAKAASDITNLSADIKTVSAITSGAIVNLYNAISVSGNGVYDSAVTAANLYTDSAITAVNGANESLAAKVSALETGLSGLSSSAVTKVSVVGISGVTANIAENMLTLDFTEMIIDGGEF